MNQQLIDASYDGDFVRVKALLDRGANPNAVDIDGQTHLHNASRTGRLEVVKELLNRGADLNVADMNRTTPLHKASYFARVKIVKELLRRGANPNVIDEKYLNFIYEDSEGIYPERYLKIIDLIKSYFPDLHALSMRSIRKHKIDMTKLPKFD